MSKSGAKWVRMVKRMGWSAEATIAQARNDGQCKGATDAEIAAAWSEAK